MEGKEEFSEIESQRNSELDQQVLHQVVVEAELPEKTVDTSVVADLFQVLTEKAEEAKDVLEKKAHEFKEEIQNCFLVQETLPQPEAKSNFESVLTIEPVLQPIAVAEHEPVVDIGNKYDLEKVEDSGNSLVEVLAEKAQEINEELKEKFEEFASQAVDEPELVKEDEAVSVVRESSSVNHFIDSFNDKVNAIKSMNEKASESLEGLKKQLFNEGELIIFNWYKIYNKAYICFVIENVEEIVNEEVKAEAEKATESLPGADLVNILTEKVHGVIGGVQDKFEEFLSQKLEEPVAEPVAESIAEPVIEPVIESVSEPVVESIAEPVIELVVESVVESVSEPVVESVAEPVIESAAEPVVESVVEPVVESVIESLAEQEPFPAENDLVHVLTEQVHDVIVEIQHKFEDFLSQPVNDKVPALELVPESSIDQVLGQVSVVDVVPESVSVVEPQVASDPEQMKLNCTVEVKQEPEQTSEIEQEAKDTETVLDVVSKIACQLESLNSQKEPESVEAPQLSEEKVSTNSEPSKNSTSEASLPIEAKEELNTVRAFAEQIATFSDEFSANYNQFQQELEEEIQKELKEQELVEVSNNSETAIEVQALPKSNPIETEAEIIEISPVDELGQSEEPNEKKAMKDKSPSPKRYMFSKCSIL